MSAKQIAGFFFILIIAMIIVAFMGCGTSEPVTIPTERQAKNHSVQYKAVFIENKMLVYRAADGGQFKMVKDTLSPIFSKDTVTSQIKSTIEKY